MKNFVEVMHVRQTLYNGRRVRFRTGETNLDRFRLNPKAPNKSEITGELGISITVYFKMMKQLILFFLFCSVLVLPTLFIYGMNSNSYNPLKLNIGSLGQSSFRCQNEDLKYYQFSAKNDTQLSCPEGSTLGELLIYHVGSAITCYQFEDDTFIDRENVVPGLFGSECNFAQNITEFFVANCSGKQACDLPFYFSKKGQSDLNSLRIEQAIQAGKAAPKLELKPLPKLCQSNSAELNLNIILSCVAGDLRIWGDKRISRP